MNVIVISAHPDDETFGCGGTLLKHRTKGDRLAWLITTKMAHDQNFSAERIEQRKQEILAVSQSFGFSEVFELGYSTMTLSDETLITMIPDISKVFKHFAPEVVYVLNRSDAHSDHLITFKATMACTKSFRYPSIKRVLMYECLSETEFAPALPENAFTPNYYVDISDYITSKLNIMDIYASELGNHPFPRSKRNVEALATYRGASVGVAYAEAFQVLKFIDK